MTQCTRVLGQKAAGRYMETEEKKNERSKKVRKGIFYAAKGNL